MTRLRLVILASTLLFLFGVGGLVLCLTAPATDDLYPVSRAIYLSNPMFIAVLGGILGARLPGHWAARAFLAAAAGLDVGSLAKGVLYHHLDGATWPHALVPWAAWLDNWTWAIAIDAIVFIIVKFAGTDRRTRWPRRIGWTGIGAFATIMVLAAFVRDSVDFHGIPTIVTFGLAAHGADVAVGVMFLAGYVGLLGAVVGVVMRYRHAHGTERAQLRWLIWSFGSVIAGIVVSEVAEPLLRAFAVHAPVILQTTDALQEITLLTVPFAVFVSVSRYGLFEIDRVVSRTVSYSLLVVLLTAAYVAVVTSATRLLPDRLGSLPVAAATLAVAAVFVPVRRRMVAAIDHRFNRARFDAELVIGAFAERVRHDGADDPNGADLLAAVQQVFQPCLATVWLVPTSTHRS